jgi:hypothetical protein
MALCRTYRRIRWGTPVCRLLERPASGLGADWLVGIRAVQTSGSTNGKGALDEGHGFSRVPMSRRLTQGDENHGEAVFDCAVNGLRVDGFTGCGKLSAEALGGMYGLQPVHKSSRMIRPLGPEVCSSHCSCEKPYLRA